MAFLVYSLCALTSLGCAALLVRAYRHNRTGLLFWSALCFSGLFLNNALLVVDFVVVPQRDLSTLRTSVGLASLVLLLIGLIWAAPKRARE